MRETVRVLHGADLHMDSPFEALPEEKAAIRRGEQRALLGGIARLAAEEKADIVLLAGDLLDSGSAYRETALTLRDALGEIAAPVFIAPGNHDWYGPRSPWARLELPENVHVFSSGEIKCVRLPELDTEVFGAAFTDMYAPKLLAGFTPPPNPEGALRLLCLHGEVGSGEGKYNPMTIEDIGRTGMDYVALGHSHACSGLRRAGDVFYAWPGCAEGRGFDETGDKGVLLVDVGHGNCQARFVPVARRKYHRLEVDLTGAEDALAAIVSALPETAARDAFRITLRGETDRPPRLEALREALSERVFALRLRDETRGVTDIWAGMEEDTLRGLFLRRLHTQLEAADTPERRETLLLAVRYGLAAMDNGEEPR